MTREEAIQYLTDTGISPEHIMELVEALEQETTPFDFELYQAGLMDMPEGMIEIFDNIKRDIFNACCDKYHMPVYKLDCDEIFGIIDEYRKEQT